MSTEYTEYTTSAIPALLEAACISIWRVRSYRSVCPEFYTALRKIRPGLSAGRAADLQVLSADELHALVFMVISTVNAGNVYGMSDLMAQALEDTLALMKETRRVEMLEVMRSATVFPVDVHDASTETQSAEGSSDTSSPVDDVGIAPDRTAALKLHMAFHPPKTDHDRNKYLADVKLIYISALENCAAAMQDAARVQRALLAEDDISRTKESTSILRPHVIASEKACQDAIKRVNLARELAGV